MKSPHLQVTTDNGGGASENGTAPQEPNAAPLNQSPRPDPLASAIASTTDDTQPQQQPQQQLQEEDVGELQLELQHPVTSSALLAADDQDTDAMKKQAAADRRAALRKEETLNLLPMRSQGSPSEPPKSIILSVCSFILVTEFCERLAYYGLTGSLPIFFRKNLGINSVLATELNSAFTSLSYLTPLIGAFVADKHLGRFATIVSFSMLYVLGLTLCVVASLPAVASLPLFMLGLFGGVGFGAGGIKPNVVVLGADQFDMDIPAQRVEKDSFFNWFYWAINSGATFSYAILTNIAVNGIPHIVTPEYGFFASFFIPSVAFVAAFLVFYMGRARYRRLPPKGSALSTFVAVLREAGAQSRRGQLVLSGGLAFVPGIILTTVSYFVNDPAWHLPLAVGGAMSVLYGTIVLIFSGNSTKWLRVATRAQGGSFSNAQVKDVTQVMRLMPYLSIIIIFWAVYGQQSSNFVLQGCQMDLRLGAVDANTNANANANGGANPTLISSAMLNVLDSGVILVFIPIFDRLIYPCMGAIGLQPTLLRKIGFGLFFSFLAMIMAGRVEQERKRSQMITVDGLVSNCAAEGENLLMSDMSVWWQTPQYLLIGISEILTSISSYDLFYSEVPESMRSVCQALNLLTTTLGYIVAGGLNSIFSFWVTSDLNDGHLEYIFFVMAFLVALNIAAFIFVSQSFEYHAPQPQDTQTISVTGFSPALPRAARALIGKIRSKRNNSSSRR